MPRGRVPCAALTVIALTLLSACSQPARAPRMTVHNVMEKAVAADTQLEESFAVGGVTGGHETNPLWTPEVSDAELREALERSLERNRMLAAMPDSARYLVTARVLQFGRPLVGFSMRVSPRIAYRVVEMGTEQAIFDEVVSTSYTVDFAESPLGAERLRLANEGAIRESIREFLNRFHDVWIARVAPTPNGPSPAAAAPSS